MEKKKIYTETGNEPRLLSFHDNHEYIWDRVQRERAEGDPKYLGGQCRNIKNPGKPFPGRSEGSSVRL